jgi:hypothetical protein
MTHQFYQIPAVRVQFSKGEVEVLVECSKNHYDGVCRSLGQRGGKIYGLNNQIILCPDREAETDLQFRDLDLLCKVTEPYTTLHTDGQVKLHIYLVGLLNQLS